MIELRVEPFTGTTVYFKYAYEVAMYVDDNLALPDLPKKLIPLMRVEVLGYYPSDKVLL